MKLSLEKIINKDDLIFIGVAVGITAIGTGIYSSVVNIHTLRDAWEISVPFPWADSYWDSLKTFVSIAKYSIPISAVFGYIMSKIVK